MKKMLNSEMVQGRVYEHNLAIKTVQNKESENYGKEFISGSLDIATDEAITNIVTINFTYVTPTTKKGNTNPTYEALKSIIETGKTVFIDGKDVATKVKAEPSLAVNDFYTTRDGQETLVSAKRNDGGFVHIINPPNSLDENENKRNTFEVDMLINGVRRVEANDERDIPEHLIVKGAVFNFRNELMPVELKCYNPGGMNYFESLDASSSNMVFTKVWGNICSLVKIDKREEESAWGEPIVKEYQRTIREWVITGSAPEPYDFGDESILTAADVQKMIADRELKLATEKKRQDDYKASRAAAASAPTASPVGVTAAEGSFTF